MKILHTADWHLGQKLFYQDREEAHNHFLKWLLQLIKDQNIDALLLCGDVFDNDMPPLTAQEAYNNFLADIIDWGRCQVVVVAGNHDSGRFIETPKNLLHSLSKNKKKPQLIQVVGHQNRPDQPQCLELYQQDGSLGALVAALPYLRDRDLRQQIQGGELGAARIAQLREGLRQYYQEAAEALVELAQGQDIPLLATGHLYVQGSERDGRGNRIHMGSLEAMHVDDFPETLDYVALGHLHRPQALSPKVQYSGSPIPMDFNEKNYRQVVKILEFGEAKSLKIKNIEVPQYIKLRHYLGSQEELQAKLEELGKREGLYWLRFDLSTELYNPSVESDFRQWIQEHAPHLRLLSFRQNRKDQAPDSLFDQGRGLEDYQAEDVFDLLLRHKNVGEDQEELRATFKELLQWMQEREA